MTDEQFKQLMDKLEEIKRLQFGTDTYMPRYPRPLYERTYWDGFPVSWTEQARD